MFQDTMPYNHCWGCGPTNSQGLQLKSYWEGEEAVSAFQPQPYHMAGPAHFLNGGIIATIIDCHRINTAMAHAYYEQGREIGSSPIIWFATASLVECKVYLKQSPAGWSWAAWAGAFGAGILIRLSIQPPAMAASANAARAWTRGQRRNK